MTEHLINTRLDSAVGGRIELSDGEGGRGLCATVWLPLSAG